MSYKNQPMNMEQALVIIAELENKLRIEEEAVKLLNEDLKEMFQRLKKAQRTASDFQERYNGLLSENSELEQKVHDLGNAVTVVQADGEETRERLESENRTLVELLEDLEKGTLRYYKDSYLNINWEVDDTGRPCDPEYYILQDLLKIEEVLKRVKSE